MPSHVVFRALKPSDRFDFSSIDIRYHYVFSICVDAQESHRKRPFTADRPSFNRSVTQRNGRIFEDAITTAAGVVTDSIYFEIWFEDLEDATGFTSDTLFVSGYRRTGFTEDEH